MPVPRRARKGVGIRPRVSSRRAACSCHGSRRCGTGGYPRRKPQGKRRSKRANFGRTTAAALALTAILAADGFAQNGQITGRITDSETLAPLSAVQVYLQGTSRNTLSNTQGTYTLSDVAPGTYTLVAQRIGYQELRRTDIVVGASGSVTVNLDMAPTVLALQEVVATGLVDPVEGVRSPVVISRVSRESMPVVASGSAVQNLQGRISGLSMTRQSGQPGSGTTMMLRTPTSVTGSNSPLLVVDGVILGDANTTNIESFDIESIEVVKGAAAASLYGSQAGSGVIAITTNRGRNVELGRTRFSATTEFGFNETFKSDGLPQHHAYRVDDPSNPTTYLDEDGNPTGRAGRVEDEIVPGIFFMDKPYPGPTYDNVGTLFRPGNYSRQSLTMQSNSESTNMAVSVNRQHDYGTLENNDGYTLSSARLNMDHRFLNNVSLGVSAYHSRDHRDNVQGTFSNMLSMPIDLDLSRKDENGNYLRIPDESIPVENPLWAQRARESDRWRDRTLGNAMLRWEPASFMSFMGSASFDRQNTKSRSYTPKGTPTSATDNELSDGSISYSRGVDDAWNAEAQVQFRGDLGPLNARTTFRGIWEGQHVESIGINSTDFFVIGVPTIGATPQAERSGSSSERDERSVGLLWDTALDYAGKYIGSVLVRRDGSSRFGPDNRWHTYYRVAAAWRMSEEAWFNLPNVDEFKISYSRGTAGGRPGPTAQYETWSVGGGIPSKGTLGNRDLRPEHTTEQNVALETILFGRFGAQLSYAWQRTENQLYNAPLPGHLGYSTQWQNGGTVVGNTLEASLEARVITTPTFSWTTNFVADRSRGEIEEWPFPCEAPSWRYRCEGVGMYEIWGYRFLESPDELATHRDGAAVAHASEFDVNDDGFLVWVGEGNSYRDGIAKNLWGTSTEIGGATYDWGMPFLQERPDGSTLRQKMGDASHTNFGWINTLRYQNLTVNMHWNAAIGGQVVNREFQELLRDYQDPSMDQAGKPDELKKPVSYYSNALYANNAGSTYFVESADYLKLRSLSAHYRLNPQQLNRLGLSRMGMESVTIGLIGRNILSFSPYRGWDPEQALNLSSRSAAGSASYPSTRNYTLEFGVTF